MSSASRSPVSSSANCSLSPSNCPHPPGLRGLPLTRVSSFHFLLNLDESPLPPALHGLPVHHNRTQASLLSPRVALSGASATYVSPPASFPCLFSPRWALLRCTGSLALGSQCQRLSLCFSHLEEADVTAHPASCRRT